MFISKNQYCKSKSNVFIFNKTKDLIKILEKLDKKISILMIKELKVQMSFFFSFFSFHFQNIIRVYLDHFLS